ncbi:oligosaccharide flippase family protein [Phyllobacterium sp. LjRoot231]|uniref:oligosaccharide flippase family protein n=1 Tax=Phyllobacterium sp. LjRoot231 TaxID=3342289 RepID=UPI003ECD015E
MAALEQYSQVIVSIAMIAVLSRLLGSTEIGIAVIGLGIGTIAFNFREFVTSEYLIQRDNVSEEDVRTGFTLIFGFSLAIGSFLILLSHWLAGFYSETGLIEFVCILAISGVIDAPVSTIAALLRRDMEFGTLTRINALGSIVNALVTITFAWFGFGFMSFAWGTFASALVRVVLGFHARPIFWMFKPRLKGWHAFFVFGGYKGASTVLDRTYEALPQLVLGRIMPLTAVGLYNRANVVSGLPDKILLSAIFSVAFPAFAAEARAKRSVKDAYLRIISYITALYWPAVLVVAILAHPIVHVALGGAWDGAVPLVRILSISAIFWFPNILTFPVLVALGANREAFQANFIGRGMSMIVICTASFFGLYTLVFSQFITLPFQMFISLTYVRRHAPFDWQELFAILGKSALVALGGILGPLAVLAAHGFQFDLSIVQALLAGVLSAIGWLAALLITKHPFLEELFKIVGVFMPRFLPSKQGVPAE